MIIIYHQITGQERDLIALYKNRGCSVRGIAGKLGKSVSSVSRELMRNSFKSKYYVAIHAQAKAAGRKAKENSHPKIATTKWLEKYIRIKLQSGWSPEQIAGRLKLKSGKSQVCHETIYRYIYQAENLKEDLRQFLPRHHKKRRKWSGRRVHRGQIERRVSIHDRPETINTRDEFGHWENDTVEGKGHKDGLHTTIERLSRFYIARKISRIASGETIVVQKQIFSKLPASSRLSATHDNGRENHEHYQLTDELGMDTYFADPYSSWQRGSNENANGILRRYFPKGTDFAQISQVEIDDVVWEINSKPRKCLGYNTAKEVFDYQLKCCASR